MRIRRACPICGKSLSFSSVIIPGLKGGDERVYCKYCGNHVSSPVRRYSWIGLLGLPFGLLSAKVPGYFGLECSVSCDIFTGGAIIVMFFLLVYYLMPLKR